MRASPSAIRVLLFLVLALATGCGGEKIEGPPTFPVKGKVEFTKGGKVETLADRSVAIEFQSIEQPQVKAFGAILEDGTFAMTTNLDDKGKPGVIAGSHRVRLSADEGAARFIAPQFLRHESSGITVKVPVEGDLVIKVWK